jgi:hypothetical protein
MSWYPIGPDFVFSPRNVNFKRLSRRNEWGRQGLVSHIAVDQSDPSTIYVVERPSSGGTSAFRTRNDGESWFPIADALQQVDPAIDPCCIAINPAHPNLIYMAAWSNTGVYVSSSRGDPGSWSARYPIPGNVRRLIVDPRTAADPATTVLYAATTAGVYRSPDGGASWTQVLAGDVWSLVAHIPSSGTAHFYAGVWKEGVYHATDPTALANWTNLNMAGIGLPAHTAGTPAEPDGNFNAILVDYCPRNPDRVYAWMAKTSCDAAGANCGNITAALYTTGSPLTSWTSVPMTPAPGQTLPPGPAYGWYCFNFAAAPSSPGDGSNDVLFFGSVGLCRSIDGGQTWAIDATSYHADQHAFAFFPDNPPAGVISTFYLGCDGGIAGSSGLCDPAFAFDTAATDFNEGFTYIPSGVYQNYNRGKQSSAVYQYNSHPAISALGYIGCQDTGISAGRGALGWRGIADADAGAIAVAPGADGVKVWGIIGAWCDWPGFRIWMWTDRGDFSPPVTEVTLGGSLLAGTSNYVVGLDDKCLAGATSRPLTTLANAITAAGSQAATPASMSDILMGSVLAIGGDPCYDADREDVTVTAVNATTFTANFTKTHAVGTRVRIEQDHNFVARIDGSGIAERISQEFGTDTAVIMATSPVDPDILYCATKDQAGTVQKVWMTNSASTASSSTTWTEMTTDKPAGINVSSIALDFSGNVYVLLQFFVTTGSGEFTVSSPLFQISAGSWVHQSCAGLPAGTTTGFGKLVADPVQPDTLYASNNARVFKLTRSGGLWTWEDISAGLPGQWIYDLWIGNIAPAGSPPKVLLRAAIPTRAIWEQDVTAGAGDPPIALYFRDNFLDQGWLPSAPDGIASPYDPANPGATVFHYHCADIKIDARQAGSAGVVDFFQTDPEATIPPSHVLFDELRDNSENLPQSDAAWIHVQVHNRAPTAAQNVRVWVIYCNASGGLPGLNVSPSTGDAFAFWSQFTVTGQIIPNLPADSPWKSVGAPQILNDLDAANPKVGSWPWTIPTLSSGDTGHFCMVAFIHSATSPINESSMNVDELTPRNKQVGQKNLHIGPPLPPSPSPGGGGGGGGPGGVPASPLMREYIEFHNPSSAPREASLVFDLRALPPQIALSFRLTKVATAAPLGTSLSGVASVRPLSLRDRLMNAFGHVFRCLGRFLAWLGCWVENFGRWLLNVPLRPCRRPPEIALPKFAPEIYEASPSSLVEVRGVKLPAFGSCAALLAIRNTGTLESGSEYTFQVQQRVNDQLVGGSTYVVRIAGEKRVKPRVTVDAHRTDLDLAKLQRIEREAEPLKYVPPWAKKIVEKRETEQGRKA